LHPWLAFGGEYVNKYKQYINERENAQIYAVSSTEHTGLLHKVTGEK
jgi:hypothetical protein